MLAAAFGELWPYGHKVNFDQFNRLITIAPAVSMIDVMIDLYSDSKEWLELNTRFRPPIRASGGDPLPGGTPLGRSFFLTNGWRILLDHAVVFDGNLYSDDYATPFVVAKKVVIAYQKVSNLVQNVTTTQNVITGDLSTVPSDVWAHGSRTLSVTPPTAAETATATWSHATATQAVSDIAFIKGIEGGRWKIVANQMVFYAVDNVTEIARFDLKDANGVATMSNPMERVRI